MALPDSKPGRSAFRHELRTPINHILGYCEMLLEEPQLPSGFQSGLEAIRAAGRQLMPLISRHFGDDRPEPAPTIEAAKAELRRPIGDILACAQTLGQTVQGGVDAAWRADLGRIERAAQTWLDLALANLAPPVGSPTQHSRNHDGAAPALAGKPDGPGGGSFHGGPVSGRILIADDDPANRDLLSRRLQRHGYQVSEADGGRAALERLRRERFDLLLLDVLMPDLDGREALEEIKADPALRDLPVIMLSALDQESDIARCIELGADDFVAKPFNPVFLRARIGACLEKKRLRDQERATHQALVASQRLLARELAEAGAYVQSLLPPPIEAGPVRADWAFRPSAQLGGDAFGYHWIDEDRFAIYLLDVCGHGVGAALLSVSALNVLRSGSLLRTHAEAPAGAVAELNRMFPMEAQNENYFTLWLGVFDRARRRLRCASAGHPPAALSRPDGGWIELRTSAPPVGAFPDARFAEAEAEVAPGAHLLVFSDGAYEFSDASGRSGSVSDFIAAMGVDNCRIATCPLRRLEKAAALRPDGVLDDDFSMVRFYFAE